MASQEKSPRYSLAELAEKAGVPARTLRYYIARGLLPGPHKRGRDAAYGEEHLARLNEIRDLQAQGFSLAQIGRRLAEQGEPTLAPQAASWRHYAVADDVVVMVRESASPWRIREVLNAFSQVAKQPAKQQNSQEEQPS